MKSQMQLLTEAEERDTVCMSADEAARILGTSSTTIRLMARNMPERLGFPVLVFGKRVKIPRMPFIRYLRGTSREPEKEEAR